jgi:hypothetical protein
LRKDCCFHQCNCLHHFQSPIYFWGKYIYPFTYTYTYTYIYTHIHTHTYSGAKKYIVSHQLCKFSHLKR